MDQLSSNRDSVEITVTSYEFLFRPDLLCNSLKAVEKLLSKFYQLT